MLTVAQGFSQLAQARSDSCQKVDAQYFLRGDSCANARVMQIVDER
jgi:hypothetical protein